MSNINEQIYIDRLQKSPKLIREYISEIFLNNSYLTFLNKYNLATNKEDTSDFLRNEVVQFLLKIKNIDQFIDSFVEILELTPENAGSVLEDFFNICIPKNIQDIIDSEPQESETPENLTEKTESTHISHQDLLSEIENPTPSISTTTDFQNRVVETTVNTPTITATTKPSITTSTALTNSSTNQTQSPSLHSSDPSVVPYTNPALHIATKLDQNLGAPSASIPKDVYVSKKPDPYHEPVDF
ncbi:MAG: hypothetical protein QG568_745 [Patescibacteria group bacterium]|nr:hypothetical protein [Patescibacteria group bacterium]